MLTRLILPEGAGAERIHELSGEAGLLYAEIQFLKAGDLSAALASLRRRLWIRLIGVTTVTVLTAVQVLVTVVAELMDVEGAFRDGFHWLRFATACALLIFYAMTAVYLLRNHRACTDMLREADSGAPPS